MKRGERPPLSRTFLALQNRNYRLFWFGQIVSLTGTWMQNIALAWLVLRVTNSPLRSAPSRRSSSRRSCSSLCSAA